MFFFLSHKIANAPSYFLTNRFHLWIALKKPLFQYICLYLLLIMLMYIVINNKLRQKISILALLKQFKFKINLSRNNLEHLLWLNFERQKEVNIKGICSFVTDFGNFKGEKWSNIVEYSRRKTFLILGHLGEMLRWWTDQRKVYKWLGGKNGWRKSIRLLQRKHQRMDGVLQ